MTRPLQADWFFHYTTASGLQGILNDRAFWATDANYLNDFLEIQQGVAYAREWLEIHRASLTKSHGERVVNALDINMRTQPGHQSGQRMFVCSFSEDGDSLSQWRAYGGGEGYGIGIHGSLLRRKAGRLGLAFERCVYDHDSLDNPVVKFLDGLLQAGFFARFAEAEGPDPRSHLLECLCNGVMRNSIILKGKAFAEEREWRLFPGPTFGASHTFLGEFRIRNHVFVPFTKFPLFPDSDEESYLRISDDSRMSVLQLMIGPTNYKELAHDGLSRMLWQLQYKYEFLGPSHSSASYRNW